MYDIFPWWNSVSALAVQQVCVGFLKAQGCCRKQTYRLENRIFLKCLCWSVLPSIWQILQCSVCSRHVYLQISSWLWTLPVFTHRSGACDVQQRKLRGAPARVGRLEEGSGEENEASVWGLRRSEERSCQTQQWAFEMIKYKIWS